MIKIALQAGEVYYPVYIGHNIAHNIGRLMGEILNPGPCLVVTDHNVVLHYNKICHSLQKGGFKPLLEVLDGGEKIKTPAFADILYRRALESGLDRQSSIIALGGGVIGDLAGFVAATYLRGIPFIQMPTSLLAMVDSSVGGKVAVNHPLGKNLIGAFHQPSAVISDTAFLKTLPPREWRAGMAEVIKYSVIKDAYLFSRLEAIDKTDLQHPRGKELIYIISRTVQLKGLVVARDAKDHDQRRILNFGHTFGHALEAATGFTHYLHGEAVAVGMQMAAVMAEKLGILDCHTTKRIIELVNKLNPPPPPPFLSTALVKDALYYDKKKEGNNLVFVLPETLGRVGFYKSVPQEIIHESIAYYLNY